MPITPEALEPRARDLYHRVKDFIDKEIKPQEPKMAEFMKDKNNLWKEIPQIEQLKVCQQGCQCLFHFSVNSFVANFLTHLFSQCHIYFSRMGHHVI